MDLAAGDGVGSLSGGRTHRHIVSPATASNLHLTRYNTVFPQSHAPKRCCRCLRPCLAFYNYPTPYPLLREGEIFFFLSGCFVDGAGEATQPRRFRTSVRVYGFASLKPIEKDLASKNQGLWCGKLFRGSSGQSFLENITEKRLADRPFCLCAGELCLRQSRRGLFDRKNRLFFDC